MNKTLSGLGSQNSPRRQAVTSLFCNQQAVVHELHVTNCYFASNQAYFSQLLNLAYNVLYNKVILQKVMQGN